MTYRPVATAVATGVITTDQLGGDVTTLAKTLLTQATPTDAKTTLEVSAGGAGVVPPITL